MREFVGEYGKGVRQENFRSKTKELTCTLPYAFSMRPSVIRASSEDCQDVTTACQIKDANVVLRNPLLKSFLENAMRKLGANQKLKSGIFCVLESGICKGRIRNPAPGIRNPQRGIQNLILSWITLHGANKRLQ